MLVANSLDHFTTKNTIKLAAILLATSKGSVIAHLERDEILKAFFLDTLLSKCLLLDRKSDANNLVSILLWQHEAKGHPSQIQYPA